MAFKSDTNSRKLTGNDRVIVVNLLAGRVAATFSAAQLELVALARESELAVVLLVIDHVHDVAEHFATIPANQNVRATCKKNRRDP